MLNSESEKRTNERLKTLHLREKKYERILGNPIRQKELDNSDSIQQGRYKTLIENIPCAVYSAYPGKTGPTTFMSDKWKDWTGYSPEELYHDPEAWPKCIHPDDREKAVDAYSGACQDNVPYNLEYRIVHKETGQVRYVRDQGLLSKDEKDDIIRVDGIITDISELKQVEKSQRDSEEKLRNFLDGLGDIAYETDASGNITYANKMAEKITGVPLKDIIRKPFLPLLTKESQQQAIEVYERTLNGEGTEYELTFTNGRICHFKNEPLRDENGKITGVFGIARDVTERKRVEKALRDSEERFRMMLENLPNVAVQGYAPDGTIRYWNKANESIYGYTAEEALGKDLVELIIPPEMRDSVRENIAHGASTSEMPPAAELNLMRKDGSRVPVWSSHVVIRHGGKEPELFCIDVDLSEPKRTEKALRESQERFRDLFNNALLGLYRTTPDGRILMANPTLIRMLGYDSFEELAERNLEEEGFEPQYIRSNFKERIKDEGSVIGLEADWIRRDGTILSIRESASAIRDKLGNILYYEGTVEDITERKRAEKELKKHRDHLEEMVATRTLELEKYNEALQVEITERRQAEEALRMSELRFRSLIEQTTDAVFCYEYDPPIPTDLPLEQQVRLLYDGVLVECNDVCAKSYGADRAEDVIGKRLTELFGAAPGSLDELFTEMIEGGYRTVDGEGVEKHEDGTERYYLNNGHGIIEDGKLIRVWGTFQDITERKQSEEALRETTNLLETIFEHTHMLVAYLDAQFNFVRVNRAYAEADEHQPSFFPGKNHFDLYPNEENEAIFRRVIETGNPYFAYAKSFEYAEHPERGISYWDWSLVPIKNQQGIVSGLVLTLADVTARKQAEEALKESEEKFRSLAEQSPNMIFINKKGKVVYANKKSEEVMGYTKEELCSPDFDFRTLIAPESLNLVNDSFAMHLRDEEVQPYDYCLISKNGERIEAINASKLIQYEGQMAILGVVTDITERKRAEQALRESEERLKVLFESAPDAIYLIDSESRFVDVNRAALELVGFARDEAIGKSLAEMNLLSAEQLSKAEANLKKVAAGKLSGPNEYDLKRKDGSYVSVEVRTFPVKIEGKMLTLGIARDITEHKRTEQELLEYQAKLKSLASQLSLTEEHERHRLATDLHDQISQSLVISKIKLDQLRKSSSSDEFAKSLDDISNCLGQTIDDTRALTFDLSYPILYELGFEAAVAEWLADQIQEEHGIRTEFIDDGHQKPLDDDIRVLLFRNVRELLINVVKHAQANNVRVSIRKIKDNICVSVEDDGVGFDPIETTSLATKRAEFGLFSIRERLEQLGGQIEVDSEMGDGSRITMTAPLKYDNSSDRT